MIDELLHPLGLVWGDHAELFAVPHLEAEKRGQEGELSLVFKINVKKKKFMFSYYLLHSSTDGTAFPSLLKVVTHDVSNVNWFVNGLQAAVHWNFSCRMKQRNVVQKVSLNADEFI